MKINSLIKFLTLSNLLMLAGWGFVGPIFAVYVTSQIQGGELELVGIAVAVNLVIRSVFQLPFARLIDSRKGEIDDFVVTAVGSLLISIVPFLHIWASRPAHVLILQGIMGFGAAMSTPGWLAIFTRHIDRDREAEEWGICQTMVGLGMALTGALGAFLADKFGFPVLFMTAGATTTFGAFFLLFVYQDLRLAELADSQTHHGKPGRIIDQPKKDE